MASPDPAPHRHFFLTHTLPLLGYLAIIVVWSHRSAPAPFPVRAPLDKLAHVIEFLGAGMLLARWWIGRRAGAGAMASVAIATVLGALFAVTDEVHQSFVPGRSADVGDVAADTLGVLLGASLWTLWTVRARRRARRDGVPASPKGKYTAREGR